LIALKLVAEHEDDFEQFDWISVIHNRVVGSIEAPTITLKDKREAKRQLVISTGSWDY